MSAETHTLTLSDGRTIAWCEYGDTSSTKPSVFYFHSMPSSRFEGALWDDLGKTYGLRIICPDRPGSGLSSYDPNRTFLSYPADILELAAHLDVSQFRLLSVSGGGPYAFACLKSIPAENCLGGQIVSAIYPLSFGTKGMSLSRKTVMFFSYWTPGFLGWMLDWRLGGAARDPDPKKLKDMFEKSSIDLPERDQKALLEGNFGKIIFEACKESCKGGAEGISKEANLLALDWGFELEDIDLAGRDLTIWHGKQDANCPFVMAGHAASLLPSAKTIFLDEEGHSVVAHHTEAIVKNFFAVSP